MGQLSAKLRTTENGLSYWCQSCEEMHAVNIVPEGAGGGWTFAGTYDAPTFKPSVRVTGVQGVNVKGEWTGEWKTGPDGKPLPLNCHTFITDGKVQFLADCTDKARAGTTEPLPDLPDFMCDPK